MLVNLVFAAAEPGAAANPVSFDVWTLIFQSLTFSWSWASCTICFLSRFRAS